MTAGAVISLVGLAVSLVVSALIVAHGYGKLIGKMEGNERVTNAKLDAIDKRIENVERAVVLYWEPSHEKR